MFFIFGVVWSLKRRKKGDKIIKYIYCRTGFTRLFSYNWFSILFSIIFTEGIFREGKNGKTIINKNMKNGIIKNLAVNKKSTGWIYFSFLPSYISPIVNPVFILHPKPFSSYIWILYFPSFILSTWYLYNKTPFLLYSFYSIFSPFL